MTTPCSKAFREPFQALDFKTGAQICGQVYECETMAGECPLDRLRMALAEAYAIINRHQTQVHEELELKRFLAGQIQAAADIATLTPRQHEILELVLIGTPSKNIAADLHISQRTVENHRAAIMKKTNAKSLPALGRIGLTAHLHEQRCIDKASNSQPDQCPPFSKTP